MNLIEIKNLNIEIGRKKILKNINFRLEEDEIVGIIGESGSGKTTLSMCILDSLGDKWCTKGYLKKIKNEISLIPQHPILSFNPIMTIENHFFEIMDDHLSKIRKREKIKEILERLFTSNIGEIMKSYPFELSGGMLQRINIALSLIDGSKILICDEFTSNLDYITESEILELIKILKFEKKLSLIIISHNFRVIKELSDRVYVMQDGSFVEEGYTEEVFLHPKSSSMKRLLDSVLTRNDFLPKKELKKVPILSVKNISYNYEKKIKVLKNISFSVNKFENFGIVGESGSGKSTLSKILVGLNDLKEGTIYFHDVLIDKKFLRKNRKKIQIIFQNSILALNPYKKIRKILLDVPNSNMDKIMEILREVGLDKNILDKYPRQFSGGQAQRICIARALLLEPEILILDEPTSSLDVNIQKQILELLRKIQKEKDITYILISHNLETINFLCDKIIVLHNGNLIETIERKNKKIIPTNDYTKKLFELSNRE